MQSFETNQTDNDDSLKSLAATEIVAEPVQLPVADYRKIGDYHVDDIEQRSGAYVRFIEKSTDELDGEIEYDVDEEDIHWLADLNSKRETCGLSHVKVEVLELLMDRLEKESYFQATVSGQSNNVVDDDAVCCICNDGECQNTNVILFCDMCNLAVHQDCYGVPYIPEGQWLCRRCLQSPSKAVNCVLCPNIDGAFKQTDKGEWAHVVCALWIPEVRFANTVFLEPIDSIELISSARWKLTCYVCKRKGIGACIQCHKSNCYAAFHVTCAQYACLYMKMDTTTRHGGGGANVLRTNAAGGQPDTIHDPIVRKIAYCHSHAPSNSNEDFVALRKKREQLAQQARKSLKKKIRSRTNQSNPVIVSIPKIPDDRLQQIGSLVSIAKKQEFLQRLVAYWTLKRQYRNGVPLLRRMQSFGGGGKRATDTSATPYGDVDTVELIRQIRYWQFMRQDLERARLLCELVRKREKIKLEMVRVADRIFLLQSNPVQAVLQILHQNIAGKDVYEIFQEPVNPEEVPDYLNVVKNPMDLSTMKSKLDMCEYNSVEDFERDFDLMIANCLLYNDSDTIFYKSGLKMRDQCRLLINQAKLIVNGLEVGGTAAILETTAKSAVESASENSIDEVSNTNPIDFTRQIRIEVAELTGNRTVEELQALVERCRTIPDDSVRKMLIKRVQSRIQRIRKKNKAIEMRPANRKVDELSFPKTGCNDDNESENGNNGDTDTDNDTKKERVDEPKLAVKSQSENHIDTNTKSHKKSSNRPKSGKNRSLRSSKINNEIKETDNQSNDGCRGGNDERTVDDIFTKYRKGNCIHSDVESEASSYSTCYSRTVSDVEKDEAAGDEQTTKYHFPEQKKVTRKRRNKVPVRRKKRR